MAAKRKSKTTEVSMIDYFYRMGVIQNIPDEEGQEPRWKFILEQTGMGDDEGKHVSTVSIHSYADQYDAIQDAYGILELLGFRFNPEFKRTKVIAMNYDAVEKTYFPTNIWFDGHDFYTESGEEDV